MPSTRSINKEKIGPIAIDCNRLGDLAERWVTILASWKGCEVFENIGCTGKTDLVLVHETLGPLQLDVKCEEWQPKRKVWYSSVGSAVQLPVYPVLVRPIGDITEWKVRWVKGREPEGWESFWVNDNRHYKVTSTQPTNESKATD